MININWRRAIKGVLLSFIPLSLFCFFVYGSQAYLLSPVNQATDRVFLSSISDSPIIGGDYDNNTNQEESENKTDGIGVTETDLTKINVKSAISIETDLINDKEIIFEEESELSLPIASLTKLMTAVISFENYDLLDTITISKDADSQLSMQTDLKLEDKFSVDEILHIMLIESSNKAAYALAEQIGENNFVLLMNQKAQLLGLENTFFADPTGLSPKNVSSANDLVVLIKYILVNYPKIAEISTINSYELENFGTISNTNYLFNEFPNIILSKTGFTNYANGCLVSVLPNSQENDYIINIVLGADDRFLEMRKLINWKNIIQNNNGN